MKMMLIAMALASTLTSVPTTTIVPMMVEKADNGIVYVVDNKGDLWSFYGDGEEGSTVFLTAIEFT
jgi:hypothetical protein